MSNIPCTTLAHASCSKRLVFTISDNTQTFQRHLAPSIPEFFRFATQNQVICKPEGRQSLLFPSLHPHFHFFIIASVYTSKSQGDMIQPCLTLLAFLKHSLLTPFTFTQTGLLILLFGDFLTASSTPGAISPRKTKTS